MEKKLLKIRLRRVGRSKQVLYRIVVAEHTSPRDGKFVEIVGQYDPASKEKNLNLKEDRIKHWLSVGAQPSKTVHRLLHKQGTYDIAPPPTRITVEPKPKTEVTPEAEAAPKTEVTPEAEAAPKTEVTPEAEAAPKTEVTPEAEEK